MQDAEAKIYRDLRWAGLDWDEGPDVGGPHGPYRQSERNQIYQQHAQQLLKQGSAYRCFCPPQSAGDDKTSDFVTSECYQNCSATNPADSQQRADLGKDRFTVRLPQHPHDPKRNYPDLVYGKIKRLKRSPAGSQSNASPEDGGQGDLGAVDTILLKSDGTPTYHFANVVDDHLMKITHVIRGTEWMASTPLHYDIYHAFGWKPPEFAHVGLLVDENQAKLSKRSKNQNLALHVSTMRDAFGVLPYTLNNFLALLGWSNPLTNDAMDMDLLKSNFDLKLTRGNAMVTIQKLWFLQSKQVDARCTFAEETQDLTGIVGIVDVVAEEVRKGSDEPLCNGLATFEENRDTMKDQLSAYCADILLADRKNYTDAEKFVERNDYFFTWSERSLGEFDEVLRAGSFEAPLQAIQTHVKDAIESFDWAQGQESAAYKDRAIDNLVERLAYHLTLRKWYALMRDFPIIPSLDSAVEQGVNLKSYGLPMSPEKALQLLVPIETMTLENIVAQITRKSNGNEGGGNSPEDLATQPTDILARRAKAFSAMVNKYLRHRLAYGKPGPSIAAVMAILGPDECRRRLCKL